MKEIEIQMGREESLSAHGFNDGRVLRQGRRSEWTTRTPRTEIRNERKTTKEILLIAAIAV